VVGAHLDAHHGLLNAIVMPYVLEYNRPVIEERIAILARAMGMDASFEAFLRWVLELRDATGIPTTLAAVGLEDSHIASFAKLAVDDPSTGSNPRPMEASDFEVLIDRALHGVLAG
jgi:alcohol dehydrogenase class IV